MSTHVPNVTIHIPASQAVLEFDDSPSLLDSYGYVAGLSVNDDGEVRVVISLHKGVRVTLQPDMDMWSVHREGQEEALTIEAITELLGKQDEDEVHDVLDALWRQVERICLQVSVHALRSVANELGKQLDVHMTSTPF